MAKLGSWGKAVRGQSQNARRSRKRTSGGFISDYRTEVGVKHRFIIPTFVDEEGNEGLFLQSRVVHPVKKWGAVAIKTKNGNEFKPYNIGTSHPYKQPSFDASVEVAKRGDVDVFSQFASLTETDKWAKVNELDNDRNTDAGKKEFVDFMKDFDKQHLFIEPASYTNRDGEWNDHIENYLLVLQLETEMVEEERSSGVKRQVAKVVLDDNGFPKYEPKFWRVSSKRLGDIQAAVDLALDNQLLGDDDLYPYTEGEGTDDEVVNYAGWVELEINYPFKEGANAKMEAGREATISAINANVSNVSDEFVNDFKENKAKELYEKALRDFKFSKSHLKAHSRSEQLEMLSADARDYFNYLLETYPDEAKEYEDRFQGYFENILEQAGESADEATETTSADTAETEEEPEVADESEEESEVVDESEEESEDTDQASKDKLDELLGGL